jgi:hypothetical protein
MRQFKDTEGRTWDVAVNIATINRVQDALKVNLLDLVEEEAAGLIALVKDLRRFFDVLWVLCQRQAEERKIGDLEWAAAMGGDVIVDAQQAFMEALAHFFPKLKREAMLKAIAASVQMTAKMRDEKLAELDKISVADLAEKLISSCGAAPASSASTPAPSPCASS